MASDNSAPKVRLLATIGLLSIFLLVGMKLVPDSYWSMTTEAYEKEMLTPNSQIDDLRAKQRKDLEGSSIPITVAMKELASKGREGASANITPQQSEDLDPMRGWAKLKKEVTAPAPTNVVPGPVVLGDGGAPLATDAGPAMMGDAAAAPASTDGGAPVHAAVDAGARPAPPPPPPHVPAPPPPAPPAADGGA